MLNTIKLYEDHASLLAVKASLGFSKIALAASTGDRSAPKINRNLHLFEKRRVGTEAGGTIAAILAMRALIFSSCSSSGYAG